MHAEPFVTSLDHTDAYKRTMNAWQWTYFQKLPVRFSFHYRNNTPYKLVDLVDENVLRQDLEMLRELSFTDDEIDATGKEFSPFNPVFASDEYRRYLKNFRLPPIGVARDGDTYAIDAVGFWPDSSWWETFVLGVVAKRAGQTLAKHVYGSQDMAGAWKQNERNLRSKVERLKQHPKLQMVEFGTRRALDPAMHDFNVGYLASELPASQLVGTSNIHLARKHGIQSKGTMAHEDFMVLAALFDGLGFGDEAIRRSQMEVLDHWATFYAPYSGDALLVALNETFGGKSFYEDFGVERARRWKGVRPDSGDPVEEAEKAIAFYERCGIDPKEKVLFCADGQTTDSMIHHHQMFNGRIKDVYGPGTHMSNDAGLPTLSIVMKATHVFVNGRWVPTVKLSNNHKKATGPAEYVERYKRIFGYTSTFAEDCRC